MEYLVIIGIVVVISLVTVGLLTGFFGSSSGVSLSQNKLFWESQPVGLSDAGADEQGDNFFVVTNNTSESITLTGYRFGSTVKDFDSSGVQPTISPGEKKVVFIAGQTPCTGSTCSLDNFAFTYKTVNGLDKTSGSNSLVVEKQDRITRLNFAGSALVCVNNVDVGFCSSQGGANSDTNWQTSWNVFDANMKATYLQLPSTSALSLPTLASGQYLTNNGTTLSWSAISSSVDTNMYTAGIMRADNNALLIDLNGGGKSLFNFLDANFTRNVKIDGNLVLNGVIKKDTCPTGWVLVPGDSNFGTNDFCVMKYEAQKSAIMQAVSIQGGTPWTDVSWYDAREACKRSGAHLITNAEWMTIARNISNQATNWQSGTVGSGCMYGGHMDNLPANKLATSDDGTPYSGTLDASTDASKCPFVVNVAGAKASRRTMNLSNGSVIWDISGNVWEWVDEQCANGSGMSSTYWYNSGAWVKWSHANLSDYELYVAGPTSGYTSANGVGQYFGCTTNGNALLRGAGWYNGVDAGAFTMAFSNATSNSYTAFGFRCVR